MNGKMLSESSRCSRCRQRSNFLFEITNAQMCRDCMLLTILEFGFQKICDKLDELQSLVMIPEEVKKEQYKKFQERIQQEKEWVEGENSPVESKQISILQSTEVNDREPS